MKRRGCIIIGLLIGVLCLGACGKKDEKSQLEKDYELSNATSVTNGEVNKEGSFKLKSDTFTLKCGETIGSDLSKYINEQNLEDYKITYEDGSDYITGDGTMADMTFSLPTEITLAFTNTKKHEYKLAKFIWESNESTLIMKNKEYTFYLKKLDEDLNIINKDMTIYPMIQEEISIDVSEFATYEQNEGVEQIVFDSNKNSNIKIPEITDTIAPGSYKVNINSITKDMVVSLTEVTINIVDDLSPEDKSYLEKL